MQVYFFNTLFFFSVHLQISFSLVSGIGMVSLIFIASQFHLLDFKEQN